MRKILLLLDYDGTIAPFRVDRNKAVVHKGIKKILDKLLLEPSVRIVIISGRAIKDLIPLLQLHPVPEIFGSHGLEHRTARGMYRAAKLSILQQKGLALAYSLACSFLPSARCEVKPFSVACHVRGMLRGRKALCLEKLSAAFCAIANSYNLERMPFKEGVEIRVKGHDKGFAVRSILARYTTFDVVAYFGDDVTDEAAFKALGKKGLKIRVGKNDSLTHVDVKLKNYKEVCRFLRSLCGLC